jgi:hypothetical protein
MNMHATITSSVAILRQMLPGQEYPDGNINARLSYTDAEIEELAASLKGPDGQLRPFLVTTHPKKPGYYFVFGGGRRRIAYERLIGRGDLPKDHPIEIRNFGHISVEEALSKSLADNQAVQMHPADQAVTFATLAKDKAPEDIARDRGMTVRAVSGLIALGQDLIPEVIAEWRSGRLDRADMQVLVLASPDQQKEALGELAEDGSFSRERFRAVITANKEAAMTRLLGFVGVEAARAGGVAVTEDFFGNGGVVKDLGKLEKLANAKMRGLEKAEIAAGWSWADGKITEARRLHHGLGEQKAKRDFNAEEKKLLAPIDARLKALRDENSPTEAQEKEQESLEQTREDIEVTALARAFTSKQRAAGGVLIRLRPDGTVDYKRGVIRKDEKKGGKKQKTGGAANYSQTKNQEPLSYNVRSALEDWQSNALGSLLSKHPREAVAGMLAGAHYQGHDAPVSIGLDAESEKHRDFGALFARFRKLSDSELVKAMGALVPECVRAAEYNGKPRADAIHIVKVVGEKAYQDALIKAFDAKVYFGGASKPHMLGVMAEAFGASARRDAEDKNEAQLRAIFEKEIRPTGWLPPELRTKVYTGPSAKKPTKTVAKKKAR